MRSNPPRPADASSTPAGPRARRRRRAATRSASGACAGEKSRPLNGGTRSDADAAAAVRQTRDRLQRFPHAGRARQHLDRSHAAPRSCSCRDRSDASAAPALVPRQRAGRGCGRRRPALRRTRKSGPSPPSAGRRPWPARACGRPPRTPASGAPVRRVHHVAVTCAPTRDAVRSTRRRGRATAAGRHPIRPSPGRAVIPRGRRTSLRSRLRSRRRTRRTVASTSARCRQSEGAARSGRNTSARPARCRDARHPATPTPAPDPRA